MKRCKRCVLSSNVPKITFNENSVCNVCINFDEEWETFQKDIVLRNKMLIEILNYYKNENNKYDCLVPISGGLDSTYSLYISKVIYGLKPLCYNFYNGFQTNIAKQNIQNAVSILNVDIIKYNPRWETLKKLYKIFFKKTGEFCTPCNVGIWSMSYKIANDFDIPLIMAGSSNRISERLPKGGRIYGWSPSYFKNVILNEISTEEVADFLYIPQNFHNQKLRKVPLDKLEYPQIVSLPDYVDWNSKKIVKILEDELNWKQKNNKYHHIDCIMETVNDYFKQKKWGFSSSIYYSMLVRTGQTSRKRALKSSKAEEEENSKEPPELKMWLKMLDISREELINFEKRTQSKYF